MELIFWCIIGVNIILWTYILSVSKKKDNNKLKIKFNKNLSQLDFIESSTPSPKSLKIPDSFTIQYLCDFYGISLQKPYTEQMPTFSQYFDTITSNRPEGHYTLILANLNGKIKNDFPTLAKKETFYNKVDVITNFSRNLFITKNDLENFFLDHRTLYSEIILLGLPDEEWYFYDVRPSAKKQNNRVQQISR